MTIQNAIKSVNKEYCYVYDRPDTAYTSDKLFLLSEAELFGVKTKAAALEGTQYEYWANNNDKTARIKYKGEGGTGAYDWWLRSPVAYDSFCCVSTSGSSDSANSKYDKTTTGVSFAFDL